MVVSLLAPAVFGMLASPALSQEQALLRDIATSLCTGQTGDGEPDQRKKSTHDCQHCILCSVASLGIAREHGPLTVRLLASLTNPHSVNHWRIPSAHPLAGQTGPPRGPPILV
jgi:hypothetical protein